MQKKIAVAAIMVILALAGALAVFGQGTGLFSFLAKDCGSDQSCFNDASRTCTQAKFSEVTTAGGTQGAGIYFETRGRNFFSGKCAVYVKITNVNTSMWDIYNMPAEYKAEVVEVTKALEGKDMVCEFQNQPPVTSNFLGEKQYCTGNLRTALDEFTAKLQAIQFPGS